MILNKHSAVVLFSGGQDSTTCLYWAKEKFETVYALGFDYGQRHRVELTQAGIIADLAGINYQVVNIQALFALTAANALLQAELPISNESDTMPNTFVPGRNLLFLTLAATYAYTCQAAHIVGGMCEADYSGYPDCRHQFIQAAEKAIQLATDLPFILHTPLMFLSKAQTWLLAQELNCLSCIQEYSHTCYEGDRSTKHRWGYGCGKCPACLLRRKGYEAAFGKQ